MDSSNYIVREQELIRQDLSDYLKRHEQKEMLRLLVAGSVDDGKSTLIGRLLYDSHLIYKDQLEAVYRDTGRFGAVETDLDLSLLTDGLRAEREQGITIDVAYRYFSTEKRSFILCDAPGHEQYTRNMATGATHCDMALLLIDARNGVQDQTRRHSLIATVMGIRKILVVINKMDLVDYNPDVYTQICNDYLAFSSKLELDSVHFIPISAWTGENVVKSGSSMPWYQGEPLLPYLEDEPMSVKRNLIDFRFPVQYVIRPDATFRGFAGNVVSGIVRKGDEIVVLPSRVRTRIKSIETFDGALEEAFAPMPVVLTTTTEVDISRGMVLAKPNNVPGTASCLETMMVWMDENPLRPGDEYLLQCAAQSIPVRIRSVRYRYDINELTRSPSTELTINDIGRVELVLQRPLVFDSYRRNPSMGSFVLINRNTHATSGGGVILDQTPDESPSSQTSGLLSTEISQVSAEQRNQLVGHKPLTVWLTGLSGSGKSTLAKALEKRLLNTGIHACILDGDNLRQGLNRDLGFSPEDRAENIRRVAEVAKLMNDAGLLVIVAFISPYRADRANAAKILGTAYLEVFVDADLEECRRRDPKGLYRKSDAGLLKGLTGVDAPYEIPENPALQVKTSKKSLDESVEEVLSLIRAVLF